MYLACTQYVFPYLCPHFQTECGFYISQRFTGICAGLHACRYDVADIVALSRELDPTRLVDTDSGGGANKQYIGDVCVPSPRPAPASAPARVGPCLLPHNHIQGLAIKGRVSRRRFIVLGVL